MIWSSPIFVDTFGSKGDERDAAPNSSLKSMSLQRERSFSGGRWRQTSEEERRPCRDNRVDLGVSEAINDPQVGTQAIQRVVEAGMWVGLQVD